MRVLVVGGTGFIGGPTTRLLAERGNEVAVLHRGQRSHSVPRGVQSVLGDRRRIVECADAVRAFRPDVVVDFVAFNADDVHGVVDILRGVARRLVVISSLDVYRAYDRLMRVQPGPPEPTPLLEDAPLREVPFPRRRSATGPGDVRWDYDKIPVERASQSEPELPGTVLRLPAVYGPGDRGRHRVGEYLHRMDAGAATFEVDAALAGWRWTRGYVDDVADAVATAATHPRAEGRTYNVGEESPSTEGDWVRAIARAAGYPGHIVERERHALPDETSRDLDDCDFSHDLVVDTCRIRQELGWEPRTPVVEALARSVAWERQMRPPSVATRAG